MTIRATPRVQWLALTNAAAAMLWLAVLFAVAAAAAVAQPRPADDPGATPSPPPAAGGDADAVLHTDTAAGGPQTVVGRFDFRFSDNGTRIYGWSVQPLLDEFAQAFAASQAGLVFDARESWRSYNRPPDRLRAGLPRHVRFAILGTIDLDARLVGRLMLVQGAFDLKLVDVASGLVIHQFPSLSEDALAASGRVRDIALQRVVGAIARDVAPAAAACIAAFLADAEDPWREPEPEPTAEPEPEPERDSESGTATDGETAADPSKPEPEEPRAPTVRITVEQLEQRYREGYEHGRTLGYGEGVRHGDAATRDGLRLETAAPYTGFVLDVHAGGEVLLGHSRSDAIPRMPDDRFDRVNRATGAPTVALAALIDLPRAFGLSASGLFAGVEASFGLGDPIRFWQVGLVATQRLSFDGFYFDISLGLGALQLSAGGDDLADVAYFVLTDQFSVDEDRAFAEAYRHRAESPLLVYASLRPRAGLRLTDAIDLFAQIHVVIAPASDRFTLAGREWGGDGQPRIPGFDWGTLGLALLVGTSIRL